MFHDSYIHVYRHPILQIAAFLQRSYFDYLYFYSGVDGDRKIPFIGKEQEHMIFILIMFTLAMSSRKKRQYLLQFLIQNARSPFSYLSPPQNSYSINSKSSWNNCIKLNVMNTEHQIPKMKCFKSNGYRISYKAPMLESPQTWTLIESLAKLQLWWKFLMIFNFYQLVINIVQHCKLTLQRHLMEQIVVSCRDLLENCSKVDVQEAML